MSERQRYIRAEIPANQEFTAEALKRVASWLDLMDDHVMTTVYPGIAESRPAGPDALAWMWACILLADACDVPTEMLRTLANAIFKGVQGELA
jgi:hypothetical protein